MSKFLLLIFTFFFIFLLLPNYNTIYASCDSSAVPRCSQENQSCIDNNGPGWECQKITDKDDNVIDCQCEYVGSDTTPPGFGLCENLDTVQGGALYKMKTITTSRNTSVNVHVVMADLNSGIWDTIVTPPDNLGTPTSQFAGDFGASIAINGDQFGSPNDPTGFAASEGDSYSSSSNEPSLYASEDNQVSFFSNKWPLWDAISGPHSMIIKGQVNSKFYTCADAEYCNTFRPRTGVGITTDNKLVIMVVEGTSNTGLSVLEFAELFAQCPVESAMNMDGGGSSTLIVDGGIKYAATPPGGRLVSNHFGLCIGKCKNGPIPMDPYKDGIARPRYKKAKEYPFPCDKIAPPDSYLKDLEFHSLRPYQKSPCNPNYEDLAVFCGPDLILYDPMSISKYHHYTAGNYNRDFSFEGKDIWPYECYGPIQSTGNSDITGNYWRERCWFEINRVKDFVIDLKDAYLPIMGNTENVKNSLQPNFSETLPSGLDDPAKVNEYVSWYLNGINGRLEYPHPDTGSDTGRRRIIDFSGPLKKLLSWSSQVSRRFEEITKAQDKTIRHDQVIYSPPTTRVTDLSSPKDSRFQYEPMSSTEDRLGKAEAFIKNTTQYISSLLYLTNITIIRQNPADLFFPHMEEGVQLSELLQRTYTYKGGPKDVVGEYDYVNLPEYCEVLDVRNNPGDSLFAGEIEATVSYTVNAACEYTTQNIPGNLCSALTEGRGVCINDYGYYCDTYFELDGNQQLDCAAGDKCVDGGMNNCHPAIANAPCRKYTSADCYPDAWNCTQTIKGPGLCPGANYQCGIDCGPNIEQADEEEICTINPYVRVSTNDYTPLADEAFSRMVAGPAAIFKIFPPKIDLLSPIKSIMDIPAASPVSYETTDGTLADSGNPANQQLGEDAEIYFPHIGSIHQYFLQCIQTFLRPKGYGNYCPAGTYFEKTEDTKPDGCPVNVPDSEIANIDGGFWLGSIKANVIDLANRWVWNLSCSGPENNFAEECYNYVVRESKNSGVNPAFSLTIWLNESGASNYCFGGPTTQDFGINDTTIYQNIEEQLSRFLLLPTSASYTSCRSTAGFFEPMHAFLSKFKAGSCDPQNDAGTKYYFNVRDNTWQWVTGGCVSPCRAGTCFQPNMTWPTEYKCPVP